MDSSQKILLISKIKSALEDRHINVVARKTGIDQKTISKARDGATNINSSTVVNLCNYFNIEI